MPLLFKGCADVLRCPRCLQAKRPSSFLGKRPHVSMTIEMKDVVDPTFNEAHEIKRHLLPVWLRDDLVTNQ